MIRVPLVLALVAFFSSGCSSETPAMPPALEVEASGTETPATPSSHLKELADPGTLDVESASSIPTQDEADERAHAAINETNFEQELGRLEVEIFGTSDR